MIFRDVEVDGVVRDVHVEDGVIADSGGGEILDAAGGALIPGLWDHHIHLLALAAAHASVDVSRDLTALPRGPGGWVRAVGYHESVAGALDRDALDRLVPDRPVRVQHRTGALWILNSPALDAVGLDPATHDGRLFGADRWLRERMGASDAPDLATLALGRFGVVGVTDMTPYEELDDLTALAAGQLPQRVVVTGGPSLAGIEFPTPLVAGPVKVIVADHALPEFEQLVGWIATAHDADRPVAVHCVTRVALALTMAAFDVAGARDGDRIEHGAVVPPDLRDGLARHRLIVVTQPAFVRERGDDYLTDVEPEDRPHLYPCAGLLAAGIDVAGSTDAPFATPDPWRAIATAIDRTTNAGVVLGPREVVPPRRALGLFLGSPDAPGGPPRRIETGAAADICLLDRCLDDVLADPTSAHVVATFVGGRRLAD